MPERKKKPFGKTRQKTDEKLVIFYQILYRLLRTENPEGIFLPCVYF